MRRSVIPILVTSALFMALATSPPRADAQLRVPTPTPAPAPVPVPPSFSYAQREQVAPPAVRNQLAQLRQEIQAKNLRYTVGYTTALDRSLPNLTGLLVPPNIAQQAAAHAPVQARLLQADELQKMQFHKLNPNINPSDTVPTFTASSSRADWRTLGKVTPIKDQGGCGSCWAFAVVGAYESSYLIRNGVLPNASEQAMLSCSGAGTCAGGWTAPAFTWLTNNGTDKEAEYPYTATNSACHAFTTDYRSAAWGYIKPNGMIPTNAEMKQAIVTYGPIMVALYATGQFQAYTGGVFYQSVPAGALNHAVVLVGWDDTKGAWILRNSWGTGWGGAADYGTERGYMYLAYGSSNVGIWSQWVRAPSLTYKLSPQILDITKQLRTISMVP